MWGDEPAGKTAACGREPGAQRQLPAGCIFICINKRKVPGGFLLPQPHGRGCWQAACGQCCPSGMGKPGRWFPPEKAGAFPCLSLERCSGRSSRGPGAQHAPAGPACSWTVVPGNVPTASQSADPQSCLCMVQANSGASSWALFLAALEPSRRWCQADGGWQQPRGQGSDGEWRARHRAGQWR